jgi:hypothetical protein
MVMKVKIFSDTIEASGLDSSAFEDVINAWLEQNPGIEIKDIKLSSSYIEKESNRANRPSTGYLKVMAMVLYKEVEQKPSTVGMFNPGGGAKRE